MCAALWEEEYPCTRRRACDFEHGAPSTSCPSASILARITAPKQGSARDGACGVVSGQRELAKSISGVLQTRSQDTGLLCVSASIHGGK